VSKGKQQPKQQGDAKGERLVATNKKARFEYEVLESVEAGLMLQGTEVKVLRQGKMSLDESYARVLEGDVWLIGANIPEYSHGNLQNHEPKRKRKCLLHAREIRRLQEKTQQKGLTLVPLKVYFGARGYAKVTIGVCRGKKLHDKRETIKRREVQRELRG
jgi:SsrA-binding protein